MAQTLTPPPPLSLFCGFPKGFKMMLIVIFRFDYVDFNGGFTGKRTKL